MAHRKNLSASSALRSSPCRDAALLRPIESVDTTGINLRRLASSRKSWVDMLRTRLALSLLIVVLSLVGSSVCQEKEEAQATVLYNDVKSGYQFQYASFLKRNFGTLVNPATNDQIFIHSQFVSWDPKPYLDTAGLFHAAIDHETVNGRRWVTITSPMFKEYYLYVPGHGVATSEGQGISISLGNARNEHPPTAEELTALRQIVSTLIFTDRTLTTHGKISALKEGDKYGALVVSRVVLGTIAKGARRTGGDLPLVFDQVDFKGRLVLRGRLTNNQTMNSGPAWVFYLNSLDSAMFAKLPQVAYPYGLDQYELHFKNQQLATQLLSSHAQTDFPAAVVVDDLSEYFGAGAIPPTFAAKLVRVISP